MIDLTKNRIAIAGVPKSGKTTLTSTVRRTIDQYLDEICSDIAQQFLTDTNAAAVRLWMVIGSRDEKEIPLLIRGHYKRRTP